MCSGTSFVYAPRRHFTSQWRNSHSMRQFPARLRSIKCAANVHLENFVHITLTTYEHALVSVEAETIVGFENDCYVKHVDG